MWIKVKMNPGDTRRGKVIEAFGYEVRRGDSVEVTVMTDVNGNLQETELIGYDETGILHISYLRRRQKSNRELPQIVPGGELFFGLQLPSDLRSPWAYEDQGLFVDVYQFPNGEYRLVDTNLPGHFRGKHVRLELGHAVLGQGEDALPSRDVYMDGELQFSGRFAQQEGNLIRIKQIS